MAIKKNKLILLIVAGIIIIFYFFGFWPGKEITGAVVGEITGITCPADYCKNWEYGSCSNKQVSMERGCYRFPVTAKDVSECENKKEIYYDTKTETVEACSQADCIQGTFLREEMKCKVLEPAAANCPEDFCLDWIYGSCSNNQQYTERECHKFYGAECKESIYYESKTVPVEKCP